MRLLGTSLLIVLGAFTVLLPILTVRLWSAVRGPRAARVAARLGLVVVSQLAAILLVAAAANDYGYFYGSWTGLWRGLSQIVVGGPTGPVVLKVDPHTKGDPVSVGAIRVVADPRFSTPAEWASRGRLESAYVRGPITGLHEVGHVYLPPEYFQHAYAHARFPAVEVFTGYPGSPVQLVKKLKYPRLFLRDLHHHRARPMVLVMLRSTPVFPRDAECTDVPGGPQVQTFYSQDVPWEISHHYRVQPNAWGAMGDSTGGYCAAKITMMNPATFHAAVTLSGYFTTLHDNTTGNLWDGSQVLRDLNSLDWRLQHLPAPPVSILVTTSRDEHGPLGITNSQRFIALARPPMQVSSIIAPHGGHNFTTWVPVIPKSLSWLSERLSHPLPG